MSSKHLKGGDFDWKNSWFGRSFDSVRFGFWHGSVRFGGTREGVMGLRLRGQNILFANFCGGETYLFAPFTNKNHDFSGGNCPRCPPITPSLGRTIKSPVRSYTRKKVVMLESFLFAKSYLDFKIWNQAREIFAFLDNHIWLRVLLSFVVERYWLIAMCIYIFRLTLATKRKETRLKIYFMHEK